MLTRKTVIWAKRETTYGTDPALTGTDAILAYDVELDIKGEKLERPILRDSLSPLAHVIGMKECQLTFKTEIKGNGLTGTVPQIPEIDDLLSGCGFDTGVYTGTTLVYTLQSSESSIGSVAMAVFMDDANKHKITGARGNVKLTLQAGNYGIAEWTFMGLYNAVTAATTPDINSTLGTQLPPIVYNASFQIAGFSPITSNAEIDLQNNVIRRDSLNATYGVQGFRLTGRTPKMSFDADAVAESSNPFWGDWEGNVVDTFGVQIGSDAGNILKISGYFEYETNKYADQDGVRKYDCEAALCSSDTNSSNDEITLTFI